MAVVGRMILMAIEAINCLQTAEMGNAEKQAVAIEQLRKKGIAVSVFELDEKLESNVQ